MSIIRWFSVLALFFASLGLHAQTVALGRFAHADYERNDLPASDAITDQLLARLSAQTSYKFVERIAVEKLIVEQALSQDGLARADGAARFGRLLGADLILSGTFFGAFNQPQSVMLEVVEPARAETVARVRVALDQVLERGHLAPLSAADMERIVAAAVPLLEEARQEIGKRPGQVLLKLLALSNRSGDAAWNSLGAQIEEALDRKTRTEPNRRLLRTHRPDAATPENELRIVGLAEADPAAWNEFADHYFWGVIESGAGGRRLRLSVWSGDGPAQDITVMIVANAEPNGVAKAAGDAILELTREPVRHKRVSSKGDDHRAALADRLMKQAQEAVGTLFNSSVTPVSAGGPLKEAQRLAAAAIFLNPTRYEYWSYVSALRTREVELYKGNARIVRTAVALDFNLSLYPRFLLDTGGKLRPEMESIGRNTDYTQSPLENIEMSIMGASEDWADVHQGDLLFRLRDRLRADFATHLERRAEILSAAAPDQDDGYRVMAATILGNAFESKLDPACINRLIKRLWPRLKIAGFVIDAWLPSEDRASDLNKRLRNFLYDQNRFEEARALSILSQTELERALASPPPPNSPADQALRTAKLWSANMSGQVPGSQMHERYAKLFKEHDAVYADWRRRAEFKLRSSAANPPDPKAAIAGLLQGPISDFAPLTNPPLEKYSAAARAKHAPELLAFYDNAANGGYPPAMIARLKNRVKDWLASSPPRPPPQLLSAKTPLINPEQPRINAASGYNPDADRLLDVSPGYLHPLRVAPALKDAVRNSDLPTVAYLLECGAPIEAAGMAFVEAINRCQWAVVEYLLAEGYDPAAPWPILRSYSSEHETFGALALAAAAEQGRSELMDRLLAMGVRFIPESDVALAAVSDRARAADLPGLKKLLAASALPSPEAKSMSASANYLAPVLLHRDLPMLQALLVAGAKPHNYVGAGFTSYYIGSISQTENWSRELTNDRKAIDHAAALNWLEGVQAMLAASGLDAESAFRHWPYQLSTDPATRALLLRANLRAEWSDEPSYARGIDLICAIVANDIEAVAAAWKNPAARQFRPRFGLSPLAFAVLENRSVIVRWLVEQGAPLNDLDEAGITPLAHAAALGDVELVRFLVAKGADKNLQRGNGNTPLGYAIFSRQKATALVLLELGVSIAPPAGRPAAAPLIQATIRDMPEVVERLLALGADPHVKAEGMGIFFPAARSNNPALIQRFADLGCDLSQRAPNGWTPLVSAVRWGASASVEKLQALGLRDPLAADAAVSISQEARSQFRPQAGELQALHYRPDYRRCLELIQEQKEPAASTQTGKPSGYAASSQAQERIFWANFLNGTEAEVVEFLKKGGNVNYREGQLTPLQMAASMGRTDLHDPKRNAAGDVVRTERGDAGFNDPMLRWVTFLLEQGADPEATTQQELQNAIVLGRKNPEIVRALIKHRARANPTTCYGGKFLGDYLSLFSVALHDQQTHPGTVRVLLDNGARIDDEARREFAKLPSWDPARIPLLKAVLTPEEFRQLSASP